MPTGDPSLDALIQRAGAGDQSALANLFDRYRDRLRQLVRLRLDQRLHGRVDPSDVLQDAYIDLAQKLPNYAGPEQMPFYVWLRLVVIERLLRVHRHHLGAAMREAGREISIHAPAAPQVSSASLAAQILGRLTSASAAVARAELQRLLQDTINAMEPLDREVISLRHFEELSNEEVASALGITRAAASKRYVRAMVRLKSILDQSPDLGNTSR